MRQMQYWTYDFISKIPFREVSVICKLRDTSYVDEKILDNSIVTTEVPVGTIESIEGVTGVHPRIQSGALVSTGVKSNLQ